MKPKFLQRLLPAFSLMMTGPLIALEAPVDDAPPPSASQTEPATASPSKNELPAPNKLKSAPEPVVAFLGVVSGEVPKVLAEHLKLKSGEGVLVRSLAPNSPALAGGISVNDVILEIAGTPVGTPAEISAEVTRHKPGATIEVELIHQGSAATHSVLLAERPQDLATNNPKSDSMNLDNLPGELAERVRDAIASNLGELDLNKEMSKLPPQLEEAMRDVHKRLHSNRNFQFSIPDVLGASPPAPGFDTTVHGTASFIMSDQNGKVEITSNDGARSVVVKDTDGKEVWSGPWNSPDEMNAAPPEIRERIDALDIDPNFSGQGLRFRTPKSQESGDDR